MTDDELSRRWFDVFNAIGHVEQLGLRWRDQVAEARADFLDLLERSERVVG